MLLKYCLLLQFSAKKKHKTGIARSWSARASQGSPTFFSWRIESNIRSGIGGANIFFFFFEKDRKTIKFKRSKFISSFYFTATLRRKKPIRRDVCYSTRTSQEMRSRLLKRLGRLLLKPNVDAQISIVASKCVCHSSRFYAYSYAEYFICLDRCSRGRLGVRIATRTHFLGLRKSSFFISLFTFRRKI